VKDPAGNAMVIFRGHTGFFGCAMPAAFARRASLRLRMTSIFLISVSGSRKIPQRFPNEELRFALTW
jgi:hypothetical protein